MVKTQGHTHHMPLTLKGSELDEPNGSNAEREEVLSENRLSPAGRRGVCWSEGGWGTQPGVCQERVGVGATGMVPWQNLHREEKGSPEGPAKAANGSEVRSLPEVGGAGVGVSSAGASSR